MLLPQFTETVRFQQRASKIIGEDGIALLQETLCKFPEFGTVIRGSGGIRKMRWASSGHGKRGGSRVIYFYAMSKGRILLLDIYSKNEKSDLSSGDLNRLKKDLSIWLERL